MCGREITDFQEAGFIHDYKKWKSLFKKVTNIFVKKKYFTINQNNQI